jgi:glycosyltransferase involved in cell wall biosynthesis
MKRILLRADLHVHSKYSERPSEWILRKIGCAESYTDPIRLYSIARERGMDLITITDHNTLNGSLEIAHLDNCFVSEEVTTYFPEDRCKLHVLVYNITEAHHQDISRCRENVYDLVDYLNRENIIHALAHALYSINERLTKAHFEQAMLLFQNFELNGARDDYQNSILKNIIKGLTEDDIALLSDKYGIEPSGRKPWMKSFVAGSDDHSSLNIATTYTEVQGAGSVEEFLKRIETHETQTNGLPSTPKTLAHNLYSIAYQFYNNKFHLDRYISKELLVRFVDRALIPSSDADAGLVDRFRSLIGYRKPSYIFKTTPKTVQELLLKEARQVILGNTEIGAVLKSLNLNPGQMEEAWYEFVNQISEKILKQFADSILDSLAGANLFDIFQTIGSAGSLYTMLAPYFLSYSVFTKDRQFCHQCKRFFQKGGRSKSEDRLSIAHFTDTFNEVNGIALTLKMQVEMAHKTNKLQTIITCGPESDAGNVTNFSPIGTFEMPEYPDLKLFYPPLLRMLNYCYERNFTHIHSATPGPIGLAALAIARIMQIPIFGTYHTALPQYVNRLMDDASLEDAMWKYSVWYYNQMDRVYVPSKATGDELIQNGVQKGKIRFFPRGIDIELFNPSKRNGFFTNRYNVSKETLKILYVGRVSKEKNLPDLVDITKGLAKFRNDFQLVVVGSGPYLDEMKTALEDMPVIFTGFLEGEDLAQAYASSDIFIFPSTTDTFGNVILEAQASGLPVIVSDKGGPKENLIHEKSGFIVPAGDTKAFVSSLIRLMDDKELLHTMKQNARSTMENRSFEDAYMKLWESYRATEETGQEQRDSIRQ